MDVLSINTMRIVLVGLSAIAAVVALVLGQTLVAGVLLVGVIAHGGMWFYLYQQSQEQRTQLLEGAEAMLRDEARG